jgi:RHS repeat-associated protein
VTSHLEINTMSGKCTWFGLIVRLLCNRTRFELLNARLNIEPVARRWCYFVSLLFAFSAVPGKAQETTRVGQLTVPPTFALGEGQAIKIEDADRILRAAIKKIPASSRAQSSTLRMGEASRRSRSRGMVTSLVVTSTGCTTSSQPIEIITLAASLKCDPDLIFEYVYNNIEYEPLFGSNKGALGALLDQRGNDIDQAQLLVALLSAAGFASSQINYQYGYIRVNGAQASGWLGVKNDGQAIGNVFSNGGIPTANRYLNGDGTLASLDVAHVWVQVQISGANYVFDPSFKQHTVYTGLSNLGTVLGYTRSQFLSDAGGTIDSVSISNLNRANVRNDLVAYGGNLINYIKNNNPGWTLNDVVGGKTIQYLTGSPLRQTVLSYLSPSQPSGYPQNWGATVPNAYRTCFTISMPGVTQTLCGAASSQTIELYADETYGHRITIFSVPSGSNFVPTLLIDGATPSNGQNTGTALSSGNWTVNVAIKHPYTGPLATAANQSGGLTIGVGGSYLIGAGWGPVGRAMIEFHRKRLAAAIAAGNSSTSEVVLGESLAVINYSWLAELAFQQRLGDATAKVTTQYHHGLGITAQTAIQGQSGTQGPYVDLPMNFLTLQPQTNYTGSGLPPSTIGAFYTDSGMASSLESAVLEQTQANVLGMQAASTVRLVDMNVATAAKTYYADGTTSGGLSAYFSSIRPNISASYSSSDLSVIDNAVSTNGLSTGSPTGKQVLLPASGNISVGLWHGAGFTVSHQQSTSMSVSQKISGGLSGGFSGSNVTPTTVAASTQIQMPAASGNPSVPAGALATSPAPNSPKIAEPIDAIGGAYIYNHTDLTTGGGSFPYALPFARTYTSSSNAIDIGLGNGWSSNYNIRASRSSNPFSGLGESSPISAAAAIAAIYVSQDLLSGTKSAQLMTVAWVVNRWLTDQLTNNSVLISWPGTNEEFTQLPHADGSTSVPYNPPLGSAVVLTGTAPDSYGNFTTFSYRNKDQSQLLFNPLDTTANAANGQLASWTWPNGMSVNLSYGYAYNNAGYLSSVSNNLGRTLTLAYSGPHLASVTDDTGRSASYAYDSNNNLTRMTDPMGYRTAFTYDGAASHLLQVFYPSNPAKPFVTNLYDGLGRVSQQSDANNHTWTFYFGGSRTETIDPTAARHITYQTPRGKVIKDAWVLNNSVGNVYNDTAQQDNLVNVARNQYDGQDRLTLTTAPEGGTVAYTYSLDLLHNLIQTTQTPKPGSPLAALTTSASYDPLYNQPHRITDPRGLVTQLNYDPATGNLMSVVADSGSSTHFNATARFSYTGHGQLLSSTDVLGTVTLNAYDERGNLTTTTRDVGSTGHLNQQIRLRYNAQGDVIALTDPNGNLTTSSYDANRRLVSVTTSATPGASQGLATAFSLDPDGRVIQTQQTANGTVLNTTRTAYSNSGQPIQTTDANGNTTVYRYDSVDRLLTVIDALGRTTTYSYDNLGRRTGVFNAAIQSAALLQQSYRPDGQLASLTDAGGNVTTFSYDGLDRLATATYPNSSTETQTYDANSNVLTRKTRKGDTLSFTYDTLNRLITKTPPSSPVVTYRYDLAGRLIGVSDTGGSIPAAATAASYATTLSYDALNRPIGVSFTPAPTQTTPTASSVSFTHGYDATNRRIGQTASDNTWLLYPSGAGTTSYTANSLNQYTAIGAVSPTYDANGNLTYDGTFTYGYDVENRLISASGAGNTVTYAYDAQGRRKKKTVNGTTTIYVTDADNREVLEYSGSSGQTQGWYAYGGGSNEVLNRIDIGNTTRQTLIPDIQGSFIGTLDSSGTLTKRAYRPFGESVSTTGSFAYTGQRIDPETNGLYYYRARMYSPNLGRFMQPDPIGYAAGTNLYLYVGDNPVNRVDPTGLRPPTDGEIDTLKTVFNNTVNYSKVDIRSGASIDPRSWPPIAFGYAVTLENTIHFPSSGYKEDFSKAGLASQAWLVHEVGHVYQHQNDPNYSWDKAAAEGLRSDTYEYSLDTSRSFSSYRYEQQATILADYYRAAITNSSQVSAFETILGPAGLGASAVGQSSGNVGSSYVPRK